MSIFSRLLKKNNIDLKPDSICPNCWGSQEYDNVIRTKMKDAQIDVNNKNASYAFIQEFVVKHLDGIKLKNTVKGQECPTCKLVVKK